MALQFRSSHASRERNRMHARKTRQRKKEHMQNLQHRADELKEEQLRLRQVINEKNTANILVGLFSVGDKQSLCGTEDPEIERLLRRPVEEIPDASKISELPALILPGHHSPKKMKAPSSASAEQQASHPQHQFPDDGIDYQLLGKDRAKCTPAELDQIRRERNRMHAKRTRDRKRMFMEEMEEMIKKMEDENGALQDHLASLGGASTSSVPTIHPQIVSPQITPTDAPTQKCTADATLLAVKPDEAASKDQQEGPKHRQQLVSQLKSLLVAAGAFEQPKKDTMVASSAATAVSATDDSGSENEAPSVRAHKRRRLEVPQSITI